MNYISYPPVLNAVSVLSSLLHLGYFRSFLVWLIFRRIRIVAKMTLIVFVRLSFSLSVRVYQRGFRQTDFLEIWYWGVYGSMLRNPKFVEIGHFTSRTKYILFVPTMLYRPSN